MRLLQNLWAAFGIVVALAHGSSAGVHRFAGGTGAPNDPYRIATAEQLVAIGSDPNLLDKHFILVDDITLNPKRYTFRRAVIAPDADDREPGFQGCPFSGSFDGNHHVIRHLTIGARGNRADGDYLGLFGAIGPRGGVRRLELIKASVEEVQNASVVGILAALNAGTIQQCAVTGSVANGREATGGLVGHMTGGSIEECSAYASVERGKSAGGLVGLLDGGRIADCCTGFRVMASDQAGGLVGYMRQGGEIVRCYTTGGVLRNDKSQYVGGLVGRKDGGRIESSFWNAQHGDSGNSEGTGLTDVQMRTKQTYLDAGWRFVEEDGSEASSPWYMSTATGYPVLDAFRITYPKRELAGQGTPEHPHQIYTPAELASIGGNPALLDKCFVLANDIDLDPNLPGGQVFRHAVIAPEGGLDAEGTSFAGQFDGQGHAIKNLTIRGGPGYDLGLFGSIGRSGYVHDLNLEKVSISGLENVGALAAVVDGTVKACRASGLIRGEVWFWRIGGLVGVGRGRIEGCHSQVAISTEDECYLVGGLVGSNALGLILNSDAIGPITCGDDSGSIGGLAGVNMGTIQNCYASGAVRGGKKSSNLGGLTGKNEGTITQCYATGPLTCDSGSERLGGLIGSNARTLVDCYATGDVRAGERCSAIGGLAGAGSNYGSTIQRCYACGHISSGSESKGLGGLVGFGQFIGADQSHEYVKNSFWDTGRTGQLRSAGGTGLDTPRMQQAQTFRDAGWDLAGSKQDGLADIWYIPPGGGYPMLSVFGGRERAHELAGQGTASHPFLITSPDDLAAVRRTGRAGYYRLTADIDLAGITWTSSPLGNFTGEFNGDGHCIRNVTVQDESSSCTGFFSSIGESSRVFGLGLENVDIHGSHDVGGLAGHCGGTVASCYVTGKVGSEGDGNVGGLVGRNGGRVVQSYARCQVTGGAGESALGSLVGCNYSGAIINCYATGPVFKDPTQGQSPRDAKLDIPSTTMKQRGGVSDSLAGKSPYPYCGNVWDFDRYGLSQSLGGYERSTPAGMELRGWLARGWDFVGERHNGTVDLWYLAEDNTYPQLALFSPAHKRPSLEGQGTRSAPYRIATAEDLGAIYYHDSTACYQLAADIDLSGVVWSTAPLAEFCGHFNGAGHVIRNLTVHGDTDLGLFGELGSSAVIEALGIEDANVVGGDQTQCLGILAAHSHGEIRNCHATGRIEVGRKSSRIGGLVGSNEGPLSQCWSNVRIIAGPRVQVVGGLLGESKAGKVSTCHASGQISCGEESIEIGGLLGTLFWEETVNNCSAITSIACAERSRCIGGLVGGIFQGDIIFGRGSIAYCYAGGFIHVGTGSEGVGGLLGSGARGWAGAITSSYYSAAMETDHAGTKEGTPLTAEELKRQASFKGWDFKSIWQISEGRDYPSLQGQRLKDEPTR